jgi:excinuclease ABC subunit C
MAPAVADPGRSAAAKLGAALERLPQRPGVYRFVNADGETLYVGKAKSLRSRVRSYFRAKAAHPPHIERMVSEVSDLSVIVVDTEIEALLLEANLIKRERPRFNVVLRDDKNFPYVKLTVRDTYPRASLVRRARVDGNLYIGPFLPASSARRTLKMLQRDFQVATCNEPFDGKRRPCLYYHLDQCLAPCAGKTDPTEYGRAVADARLLLDGRHRDLERSLEERMERASRDQQYERATRYRDALRTVRGLAVRQRVTSAGLEDQDFFGHHAEGEQVALQLFQVRQGKIQSRREFTSEGIGFEPGPFYAAVLAQYYAEAEPPPEIYLPQAPARGDLLERWLRERRGGRVRLRVPRRGPKRKLLDLVGENASLAFEARFRAPATHGVEVLAALAESLGLDEPPQRIECFDISNIQGTDSVASMVVWEGGKPRRSAYRVFTIREVDGADDTASIAEAVTRRYRRLLSEGRPLPDLVLLDGGKGQLGAAVAALTRVGLPTQPVAAIAKREEELFLQGSAEPVRLGRHSPVLQLIQRIRDEAHRFAVGRHRRRRARRTLRTELTEVPGIGPARARRLLREFGSVDGVRRADPEALARAVGPKAAAAIAARYGARRGA